MTTPRFTVRAVLDTSQYDRILEELNRNNARSAARLQRSWSRANLTLKALTSTIGLAGRAMLDLTRASAAYERQIGEVLTIADRSQFNVAQIIALGREMADVYGIRAKDSSQALYQAISAGAVSAADANEIMNQSARLAIGGVTSLSVAVDALTTVMNAYRGTGLTATDAADSMFTAVRQGKLTMDELARSIGQVTAMARQNGMTFEEVTATIAAMTANGIVKANRAIIQLRGALSAINLVSGPAKEEAKRLGVEFNALGLRARGLRGLLQDIVDSPGFNADSLSKLFGDVRARSAAMALLVNNFEKFNETLEGQEERAGQAERAFRKMTQTLAFQLQRLDSLWNAVTLAGTRALNQSGAAREGIRGLADSLKELTEAFDSDEGREAVNAFFQTINLGVAASIDALLGLIKVVRGVSESYTQAFSKFREALLDLSKRGGAANMLNVPRIAGAFVGDFFRTLDDNIVNAPETVFEKVFSNLSGRLRAAAKAGVGKDLDQLTPRGPGDQQGLDFGLALPAPIDPEAQSSYFNSLIALFEIREMIFLNQRRRDEQRRQIEVQVEAQHFKELEAQRKRHNRNIGNLVGQMTSTLFTGLGQMAADIATGEKTTGEAMKGLVGNLASTLGSFLIQMGSAVIASGVAAKNLGNPVTAVPAGIALAAAGAAFVALGGALRAELTRPRTERGAAGPVFRNQPAAAAEQEQGRVLIVNFNAPTDRLATAREIRSLLREGGELIPGGA